jgi:hypothetical protein
MRFISNISEERMPKISFLMWLSPAEKRAMKILAAIEGRSMADYTRESIKEAWRQHFPHYELGEVPQKNEQDNKHRQGNREAGE